MRWLLLSAVCVLSGCALSPKNISSDSSPLVLAKQAQLAAVTDWQISGRFGANTESDAWSGGLNWAQQGEDYQIQLSGPLGQGGLQLAGGMDSALLRVNDQQFEDVNAQQLLSRHTSWRFPVDELRYWITGQIAPNSTAQVVEWDEAGLLHKVQQADWTVEIARYQRVGELDLPRKLYLEHPEFKVRLFVDRWDLRS